MTDDLKGKGLLLNEPTRYILPGVQLALVFVSKVSLTGGQSDLVPRSGGQT